MSRATDPAAPVVIDPSGHTNYGLTIREYFAAMAMQGLIYDNDVGVVYIKQQLGILEHETYIPARDWPRYVSKCAVAHADALIAELAKEPK
jgi:hypothetical protein